MPAELDERLLPGSHPDDAVAVPLQVAANELADRRLVFDQKNGSRHERKGTQETARTRTAAPPSIRIVSAVMPEEIA